ncbi:hypothetical protein AWB69_05822 [Caballeronia udeis]|uniref:Uncharacterized protein n=1 Tax=Caballeronia udeis TaxID=1232866 RepID=A0A158IDJ6_9BURK|nr:hypothetical protein AWB69_05822 [Caballeronia udeis]
MIFDNLRVIEAEVLLDRAEGTKQEKTTKLTDDVKFIAIAWLGPI